MSDQQTRTTAVYRRIIAFAVASMLAGVVLVVLAIGFEWSGFVGGLGIGVGVGVGVVGAYLWGYANGLRKPVTRGAWLPSRDAQS